MMTSLGAQTLESLFLLWKVTGDWKWRAKGWAIFEAIEKEAKTRCGYANLRTVEQTPAPKDNSQPRCVMGLSTAKQNDLPPTPAIF